MLPSAPANVIRASPPRGRKLEVVETPGFVRSPRYRPGHSIAGYVPVQVDWAQGIASRVHFVRGGKLARLLDFATTAVTVNSTAGQQALWRGLPLKTFGASVYSKPEFVSDQPLDQFFRAPNRPDSRAYRDYRRYLLETSQVPGGYYSSRGRRVLLRSVVDMMLRATDPYDALLAQDAAAKPQLRLVSGQKA